MYTQIRDSLRPAPRRGLAVLTALAILLGFALALATPAHADPPMSALVRCQYGATPDMSETTIQNGNQNSASFPSVSDPPNAVFPGDVVRVTVTGHIRVDGIGDNAFPGGNNVVAPTGWPFAGQSEYSSVALWNNNPAGWVGSPMPTTSLSQCTAAPPNLPVRLLYAINDGNLSDNGGSWAIRTEVYRATPQVAISGIQVTQGTQTPDDQIPLIADKRTFVRVFVRNSDPLAGPISGVGAALAVAGESRTYAPVLTPSVTSTAAGSDTRSLADSFLFELDPAAIASGSRYLTVTVTAPGGAPARRLVLSTFGPSGVAANLQVFAARYSYYDVPPAMQAQIGLTSSLWQARPVSTWDQLRLTAENALPIAHLTLDEIDTTLPWGSLFVDCHATQDANGAWGCAGYTAGRAWAEGQVDHRCPTGGCWIVIMQPETDTGHHGAHYVDSRGNHVINLMGESSPQEQGLTLAHEIGHGFGLPHTWVDPTYPRADGGLGDFVAVRDTPSFSLVSGVSATGVTTAFDMMSYDDPIWFSPHNYCRALLAASAGGLACPSGLVG